MAEELPELLVGSVEELRAWLDEHQDETRGVRLVLAKKGKPAPTTLTYAEAVLEALCQGWIDGQANRRDEASYTVRFTPRRARSLWSRRNVELVAQLSAEGRMRPRGLTEVARAQADGRWDAAYSGPAGIELPPDLGEALAAAPAAQAAWDGLNSQNRYAILHRLEIVRRADTRARKIEEYVAMLSRGETIYPATPGAPAPAGEAGPAPAGGTTAG